LQTYREKVAAVTTDEVHRVAQKHVRPDEVAIVIVGDAAEVLPQVGPFCDAIEIFHTEGVMQEVSKYEGSEGDEPANVAGKWSLNIDFQGQRLPVTMTLSQSGSNLTGTLKTMLGDGAIDDGTVSGNKLAATAKAEMQGQSVEFKISGTVDGDSMSGSITAPIVPDPLSFTGSREEQSSAAN
jgi:zinc protease